MGITGLLPFLEKSSRKTNIREFSGGTVAIDSYCWLHKGIFSCADKLIMGQTTNMYVVYCMKYIDMLLKYKIKPIMVFDGRQLPAKEQTEIKRRESRQINRRKAFELIQMGQVTEGRKLLKRAIDITHNIALELIKHCQNNNIDCIVAPFEADAQLAYLNISGIADVVITEDSDLTLFGCKKVFFKMDFNGNGVLIEQDRLHLAMGLQPEQFNLNKFRFICILSGCDYLPSLPGIGLGKARKFIMRNTDDNIHRALTRMGSILNMKSLVVTQEYRDAFILADITFKHQLVFCPLQRKQVRLNPPTVDITEDQLQYAGKELNADLALQLAFGNCDPSTLKMVHDFNPDKFERKRKRDIETGQTEMIHTSIWSRKYDTRNDISFPENAINFSITTKKELTVHRDFLKDNYILSKLHNSPTIQCNRLSECQDLNKNAIFDMYNTSRDNKLMTNPEEGSKQYVCLAENNMSPELLRQKNPFIKRVSDLTTSPSVLSNGNYRKKGKNIMHIKRTIIDEHTIVESRYFSKQGTNVHDVKTNEEQEEMLSITDHAVNASLMKNIDDTFSLNQNECLIKSHENISEKSYSENRMTKISPTIHCNTIDKSYVLDNFLVSSSNLKTNNLTNSENISNLRDDLSKWSTNSCEVSYKKIKEEDSTNLALKVNSVTKSKQNVKLSSISKQSLLSMYGFQKRSILKH